MNLLPREWWDIEVISPSDPAAGADLDVTLDSLYVSEIMMVRFTLTTDATAATRLPHIGAGLTTSSGFVCEAPATHPASTARIYYLSNAPSQDSNNDGAAFQMHWPTNYMLQPSSHIYTAVTLLKAGDQISDVQIILARAAYPSTV